ncbi:hypothetical protein BJ912DRAFT_929163 [Pholiota molesta]|nr:hypothetical protein BJ912DRAFT_929163 [Pholiota molesta]
MLMAPQEQLAHKHHRRVHYSGPSRTLRSPPASMSGVQLSMSTQEHTAQKLLIPLPNTMESTSRLGIAGEDETKVISDGLILVGELSSSNASLRALINDPPKMTEQIYNLRRGKTCIVVSAVQFLDRRLRLKILLGGQEWTAKALGEEPGQSDGGGEWPCLLMEDDGRLTGVPVVLIDFEDSFSIDVAGSDKIEISMAALVIQIPEKSNVTMPHHHL